MLPVPHVLWIPIALCKYGLDLADNVTEEGQKRETASAKNNGELSGGWRCGEHC